MVVVVVVESDDDDDDDGNWSVSAIPDPPSIPFETLRPFWALFGDGDWGGCEVVVVVVEFGSIWVDLGSKMGFGGSKFGFCHENSQSPTTAVAISEKTKPISRE